MQFAYRQLDWVTVWWVDDYVPLTDVQEDRLEAQVAAHLEWHCSQELPRYNHWLARVEQQASHTPVTEAQINTLLDDASNAIGRLTVEITPTATQLLKGISDDQLDALTQNLMDSQREKEEEYLQGSRSEQLQAREERIRERFETWLGDLTKDQRALVARWNTDRGEQTRIWLTGQAQWQQRLLELLAKRDQSGFDARLANLIQNSNSVKGDAYQTTMADGREAMIALLADIINQSTPQQQRNLRGKINAVREDFSELTCKPGD